MHVECIEFELLGEEQDEEAPPTDPHCCADTVHVLCACVVLWYWLYLVSGSEINSGT